MAPNIDNMIALSIEDEDDPVRTFIIPDDDENEDEDDDCCRELTPNEREQLIQRLARKRHAAPTVPPQIDLELSITTPLGFVIKLGMTIEFGEGDLHEGCFLYVTRIRKAYNAVDGTLLRRTRTADGKLLRKCNELYALLMTEVGTSDPLIHECPIVKSLENVIAIRDVVFTNRPFPAYSFREPGQTLYTSWEKVEEEAVLVCRWKIVEACDTTSNKVICTSTTMLREYECTHGRGMSDVQLKRQWLEPVTKTYTGRYTYGDICTGAGGMAIGALMAGLICVFFLDHWKDACETLALNFPGVEILWKSIFQFCTEEDSATLFVAVLHISFPCQPYSPAHTVDGKNDDKNIAAGFSLIPLLKRHRPRVVTLEQTTGIKNKFDGQHFHAMIHQFTTMGYSLREGVLNLAEYGNAHARNRLIIIAACPGEILPPFPEPTHGIGSGKKPFTTIRDVLSKIGPHVEPHMRAHTDRDEPGYDPKRPLRCCITTSGGDANLHPSGKRTFNLRELAGLQSFPTLYQFFGCMTSIKRQIGNAVPSCFSNVLFKQIIETMKESDRIDKMWKPEVIEIDD